MAGAFYVLWAFFEGGWENCAPQGGFLFTGRGEMHGKRGRRIVVWLMSKILQEFRIYFWMVQGCSEGLQFDRVRVSGCKVVVKTSCYGAARQA